MATFYVDFLNGDDTNNAGDSFAISLRRTDGVANGTTTFTSASGGFTGKLGRRIIIPSKSFWGTIVAVNSDTNVTLSGTVTSGSNLTFTVGGAWKTITTGCSSTRIAPGDIIHIAKSPDPVSMGLCAWTSGPLPGTKNITSSTATTPVTVTCANHGYSNDDRIRIEGHSNTSINGEWFIANTTTNTFDLVGSSSGSTGTGGTARNINCQIVRLANACTANIEMCESNWVGGTGATLTYPTSPNREGIASLKIVTSSAVTTARLLARKTISQTDFSAYQQVSFWVQPTGTVAAGLLEIRLCSDDNGTVAVDTFALPALTQDRWISLTLDKGSSLGSAIRSVAIYCTGSYASKTTYFDCIIACKAPSASDCLSLNSLLSKNSNAQDGTEAWYAIQSINGRAVKFDHTSSSTSTGFRGYPGTTEVVSTYKREPIPVSVASDSGASIIQRAGTAGNLIEFQGGYNTATDIQDGETFFIGQNFYGIGLTVSAKPYTLINYLNFFRYNEGIRIESDNFTVSNISTINNIRNYPVYVDADNIVINRIRNIVCCGIDGVRIESSSGFNINYLDNCIYTDSNGVYIVTSSNGRVGSISNIYGITGPGILIDSSNFNKIENIATISNCTSNGIRIYKSCANIIDAIGTIANNGSSSTNAGITFDLSHNNRIRQITSITNNSNNGLYYTGSSNNIIDYIGAVNNNTTYALYFYNQSINNKINKISTSGNGTSCIYFNATSDNTNWESGNIIINRAAIAESTKVSGLNDGLGTRVCLNNLNDNPDENWIYTDGGTINSQTAVRHSATGIAWRLSPTSTKRNEIYPLVLTIARIAVAANSQVTVKAFLRKTHATNIVGKLVCRGRQIAGVDTDVVATMSNTADTWEELMLNFTPTQRGVVEIEAWAYNPTPVTSNSVYVDDMTITQV